jgi:hypothetical protein
MVTKAEDGAVKVEAAGEEVGGLVISKNSSGIVFRAPEPRTSTLGEALIWKLSHTETWITIASSFSGPCFVLNQNNFAGLDILARKKRLEQGKPESIGEHITQFVCHLLVRDTRTAKFTILVLTVPMICS